MEDEVSRALREALSRLTPSRWEGVVYRFVPEGVSPLEPNLRGARWNPPRIPALYTSLERETLRAEHAHRLALDQRRPTSPYVMRTLRVRLQSVIDVTAPTALRALGLTPAVLTEEPPGLTKEIGRAIHLMEHDGLLAPSARATGVNLVVFIGRIRGGLIEVLPETEILAGE